MSMSCLSQQEITAANEVRKRLYRWFADLFSQELTTSLVDVWPTQYVSTHQVFEALDLQAPSARLQQAIEQLHDLPKSDRAIELAADFAHMFLLSGKESAPPYASFYLDNDQMLYGKSAEQMRLFLEGHQLALNPAFKEPDDHLSVYLQFMVLWLTDSDQKNQDNDKGEYLADLKEQAQFLEDTLLSWLPAFNKRCQSIAVKTDVYPALVNLLTAFIDADTTAIRAID